MLNSFPVRLPSSPEGIRSSSPTGVPLYLSIHDESPPRKNVMKFQLDVDNDDENCPMDDQYYNGNMSKSSSKNNRYYYDNGSSNGADDDQQQQQKKERKRITGKKLELLELVYEHNPKPTGKDRSDLGVELEMSSREVQVWFQNRRAKDRKNGICIFKPKDSVITAEELINRMNKANGKSSRSKKRNNSSSNVTRNKKSSASESSSSKSSRSNSRSNVTSKHVEYQETMKTVIPEMPPLSESNMDSSSHGTNVAGTPTFFYGMPSSETYLDESNPVPALSAFNTDSATNFLNSIHGFSTGANGNTAKQSTSASTTSANPSNNVDFSDPTVSSLWEDVILKGTARSSSGGAHLGHGHRGIPGGPATDPIATHMGLGDVPSSSNGCDFGASSNFLTSFGGLCNVTPLLGSAPNPTLGSTDNVDNDSLFSNVLNFQNGCKIESKVPGLATNVDNSNNHNISDSSSDSSNNHLDSNKLYTSKYSIDNGLSTSDAHGLQLSSGKSDDAFGDVHLNGFQQQQYSTNQNDNVPFELSSFIDADYPPISSPTTVCLEYALETSSPGHRSGDEYSNNRFDYQELELDSTTNTNTNLALDVSNEKQNSRPNNGHNEKLSLRSAIGQSYFEQTMDGNSRLDMSDENLDLSFDSVSSSNITSISCLTPKKNRLSLGSHGSNSTPSRVSSKKKSNSVIKQQRDLLILRSSGTISQPQFLASPSGRHRVMSKIPYKSNRTTPRSALRNGSENFEPIPEHDGSSNNKMTNKVRKNLFGDEINDNSNKDSHGNDENAEFDSVNHHHHHHRHHQKREKSSIRDAENDENTNPEAVAPRRSKRLNSSGNVTRYSENRAKKQKQAEIHSQQQQHRNVNNTSSSSGNVLTDRGNIPDSNEESTSVKDRERDRMSKLAARMKAPYDRKTNRASKRITKRLSLEAIKKRHKSRIEGVTLAAAAAAKRSNDLLDGTQGTVKSITGLNSSNNGNNKNSTSTGLNSTSFDSIIAAITAGINPGSNFGGAASGGFFGNPPPNGYNTAPILGSNNGFDFSDFGIMSTPDLFNNLGSTPARISNAGYMIPQSEPDNINSVNLNYDAKCDDDVLDDNVFGLLEGDNVMS